MNEPAPTRNAVLLRLLAAALALACGIVAVIVVVLLVHSALA